MFHFLLSLVFFVVIPTMATAHSACANNSCRNGATCRDTSSYVCSCPRGYSGSLCQYRSGRLQFYADFANGLQDRDGIWNDSDPYVEVVAYDRSGNRVRRTTAVRGGDHSPIWHQNLDFGTRQWSRFVVRVWDSDNNADDALSSAVTYHLSSHISRSGVRMNCYRGYLQFNYYYTA